MKSAGSAKSPKKQRKAAHPAQYASPPCYLHELAAEHGGAGALDIQLKRIYEPPAASDGMRVLVDRLWPRGISKQRAKLDEWLKDIAPSTDLRKWFHGPSGDWAQFKKKYRAELRRHVPALKALQQQARRRRVTLLYGASDAERNHAMVLKESIEAL